MPEFQASGRISDSGELVWSSPARLIAWLVSGKGQEIKAVFERGSARRTLPQNSRYFVAFVPFIQEMMEQRTGIPWSKDMAHDLCCRVFIGTVTVEVGGEQHTFRKRSSKLNIEEFSRFTDKVERWIEDEWKINPALLMPESEIP